MLDRLPSILLPLFAAFFVAIASFVISAGYAEHRATEIDEAAMSLAENATPSIMALAAARAELRHTQALLSDLVNDAALGRPRDRRELDEARDNLSRSIDVYLGMPVYPGELKQWQTVAQALGKLDLDTDRALSLVANGRPDEANKLVDGALRADFNSTSEAVMDSIELNARQARHLAIEIAANRVRSRRIALVLNTVSVTFAVLACAAAAVQIRRHVRLLWQQGVLLERRADELEQFAGRVAHDVLSPLGAVALALDLALRRYGEGEPARKALERGRQAIMRVKRMTDGLLEFARAGARPEPGARAEVRPVVDDLMAELVPAAAELGAELCVEPFAPCAVAASPGVLTSILANLIRNALKYLGDAAVCRVVIRVLDERDAVRIEVEDTGPGIAPALEQMVFEPHVRAQGARVPGLGLGLATVKRLTEAHGGRVGLRTVVGKGSLFWFELPRASAASARAFEIGSSTSP
ncbi:sensor histidine kinase [Sorangium atrum]|uniref:histidine kinase n=1 Tax=Sorangium atrum TaxID=2995308 RepID=A0ABT5C9C3_9BACT|nr:ATP-binding protein [Sorangium aterium]MDC0682405.1 ATP-binding protein [Sorangium aterium]